MTRRPKDIGTAAESAVRDWLVADGWADCHRTAQTGSRDTGDLLICTTPWVVVAEVKGGAQAEAASAGLIGEWMLQAHTERVNANAEICPLVVRRFRRNPGQWDVWLPLVDAVWLDTGRQGESGLPVRMSLDGFSTLLRQAVRR